MFIIHKNSREIIKEFPSYTKTGMGYGDIVLTWDRRVLFMYQDTNSDGVMWEDVTVEYEIHEG